MKIEKFNIEQRLFQASILKNGRNIDNGSGDCFTSREEAEADGETMVDDFDPEWQKRNPNRVEYVVREYEVDRVDEAGNWSGFTVD